MNIRIQYRSILGILLAASILISSGFYHFVKARELTDLDSLQTGQTIDNDVFIAQQLISIDGTVNGDVFALGNRVVINGDVNGSLFTAGQSVEINGKVSGTAYSAALALALGPDSVLERNLYFIGGTFTAQEGAQIQRDLNTICLDAKISGQIGRNTNAMIGILNLIQFVIQNLSGVIDFPEWMLQPIGFATPSVGAGIGSAWLFTYLLQEPVKTGGIDTERLAEWGLDLLRQFGLLLVLGLIVIWLFHKPLSQSARYLRSHPLASLGYGLLGIFILANVTLVVFLVASLVFVLGLWIGFLGLWDFTLAFWLLSFSALGFFLASIWIIATYGTKLIVAYLVGVWLFEKLAPKANLPKFLALAVGLLIYSLLRSIPMVGWVTGVLVTAWGLGAIWVAYRAREFCEGDSAPTAETESPIVTIEEP